MVVWLEFLFGASFVISFCGGMKPPSSFSSSMSKMEVAKMRNQLMRDVNKIVESSWYGEEEDSGDVVLETVMPKPDWDRLHQIARNASLVYLPASDIMSFYESNFGLNEGLLIDSHRHLGVGSDSELEQDKPRDSSSASSSSASSNLLSIVRSDVLIGSWKGGSITVLDFPSVKSRMLIHAKEDSETGVVNVIVSIQGTANMANAIADLEYNKVVDYSLGNIRNGRKIDNSNKGGNHQLLQNFEMGSGGSSSGSSGGVNINDFNNNLHHSTSSSSQLNKGVRVHAGFKRIADALWKDLEETLTSICIADYAGISHSDDFVVPSMNYEDTANRRRRSRQQQTQRRKEKRKVRGKDGIDEIGDDLEDSIWHPRQVEVHFTGHSLGGAVACILAARTKRHFKLLNNKLKFRKPESLLPESIDVCVKSVITFGQPKLTNRAGCLSHAFTTLPVLRVTTEDDMFAYIPMADPFSAMFGFYSHFGDHLALLNNENQDSRDVVSYGESPLGGIGMGLTHLGDKIKLKWNDLLSASDSYSSSMLSSTNHFLSTWMKKIMKRDDDHEKHEETSMIQYVGRGRRSGMTPLRPSLRRKNSLLTRIKPVLSLTTTERKKQQRRLEPWNSSDVNDREEFVKFESRKSKEYYAQLRKKQKKLKLFKKENKKKSSFLWSTTSTSSDITEELGLVESEENMKPTRAEKELHIVVDENGNEYRKENSFFFIKCLNSIPVIGKLTQYFIYKKYKMMKISIKDFIVKVPIVKKNNLIGFRVGDGRWCLELSEHFLEDKSELHPTSAPMTTVGKDDIDDGTIRVPWCYNASSEMRRRRRKGWARNVLESLLDRHSYWLHISHSNPIAHSMTIYEKDLYIRSRYVSECVPQVPTPLLSLSTLHTRLRTKIRKFKVFCRNNSKKRIALAIFRTSLPIFLPLVMSSYFFMGFARWSGWHYLRKVIPLQPHEIAFVLFFLGFTGGLGK